VHYIPLKSIDVTFISIDLHIFFYQLIGLQCVYL